MLASLSPRWAHRSNRDGLAGGGRATYLWPAITLTTVLAALAVAVPARAADPVLAAAGDIACSPSTTSATANDPTQCQQKATANEIQSASPAPTAVAALGDTQYDSGSYPDEYTGTGAFDQTWGAFKSLIHPVPGNHEYRTPGATGYFTYFGSARAGDPAKGYYSYDRGAWHIVALNSACSDYSVVGQFGSRLAVGPHPYPGALQGLSDRLSEIPPIPEVAPEARDISQPPPDASP